jgi:AcrR family transcriptional regulator
VTHRRPDVRLRAVARRQATEQSILDATERLLADRMFRELTIAEVMAEAGATRTAFYRYFPDLESVLLRRLAEVNQLMEEARDEWLAESDDPAASLLDAALSFAGIFREHGRFLLALADAATGAPEVDVAWRGLVEGFTSITTDRVRALCRRGLSALRDPDEITRALVLMTERYLLETYGRDRHMPVERAAGCVALVWQRTLFLPAPAPAGVGASA